MKPIPTDMNGRHISVGDILAAPVVRGSQAHIQFLRVTEVWPSESIPLSVTRKNQLGKTISSICKIPQRCLIVESSLWR